MQPKAFVFVSMFLAATGINRADEVFVSAPKAVPPDGQTVARFEIRKAVDVEVSVLDAKRKVVRHLAAGVLEGKHAPPPPLQPGFSQPVV